MSRAFTVASLAREWECSEGAIRKRIATGEIGCFRIGTLIRIPAQGSLRASGPCAFPRTQQASSHER